MAAGRRRAGMGRGPLDSWHVRQQHQLPRAPGQGVRQQLERVRLQPVDSAHGLDRRAVLRAVLSGGTVRSRPTNTSSVGSVRGPARTRVACYLLLQLARMGTIMYLLALALAPHHGLEPPRPHRADGPVRHRLHALRRHRGRDLDRRGPERRLHRRFARGDRVPAGVAARGAVASSFASASTNGKFSLGSLGADVGQSTFWVVLLYGLFINLQNFGIDQSYVQRYQAAAS